MLLSSTMAKFLTIIVINTHWIFSTPKRHWLTKRSIFTMRWRKSNYYVTGMWNQSQQYHFTSAPNLINIVILFFMSGAPSYRLKYKTMLAILIIIHKLVFLPKVPHKLLGVFIYSICSFPSNGFTYGCMMCEYYACINCAFIPEEFTHEAHPGHLLSKTNPSAKLRDRYCKACTISMFE